MDEEKGQRPFVGRQELLDEISTTMDDVEESQGRLILLAGEAGIGKTTVANRVHEMATERGWSTMSGECMFGEGGNPYYPMLKAIHGYMEGPSEDAGLAIPTLPMGLMGLGGGPGHVQEDKGSKDQLRIERDRLFETVSELLADFSNQAPVLFLIEDLHWAENATCQLLYYLVRSLGDERILFLGTYRPEDIPATRGKALHPVTDLKFRLQREGLVIHRELESLTEEETSDLLSNLVSNVIPPNLTSKIHHDTGGNPFYIEEFVQAFGDHRALTGGSDDDEDVGGIRIPPNLSAFISARVGKLETEEAKAIQYGSVIGREFQYDLLQEATGMSEEDLVKTLDNLMEKRLLEEVPDSEAIAYRFNHSLIREVVYHNLSRSKSRFMHKKVGEAIEAWSKVGAEAPVFQLAHHFSRSAEVDKALRYNLMAADRALAGYALDEAADHLEEVLEILVKRDVDDDAMIVKVLGKLGFIYRLQGDIPKAMEHLHEALRYTEDGTLERSAIFREMGEAMMVLGSWSEATEHLRSSIQISYALKDHLGVANGYIGLAHIAWKSGDMPGMEHYGERALKEAAVVGDDQLLARCHLEIASAVSELTEDFPRAMAHYEQVLALLDPEKDIELLSRTFLNMGDVHIKLKEYDKAVAQLEKSRDLCKRTGDVSMMAYAVANLGLAHLDNGDSAKALRFFDKAQRLFKKLGTNHMEAIIYLHRAQIARAKGDLDDAEVHIWAGLDMMQEDEFPIGYAHMLMELGHIKKADDEKDRAREFYNRALEIMERIGTEKFIDMVKGHLKDLD
jgi:predicted ATPase